MSSRVGRTALLALMLAAWLAGCTGSTGAGVPGLLAPASQGAAPRVAQRSPTAAPALTPTSAPTFAPPVTPQPTELPPYWPTDGWRRSTPEAQGMDSQALANVLADINQRMHIHSLLVVRHGYLVAEAYFYPNQPDIQHQQFSVTKAVTSAAVGIAVGQGLMRLDQPVLASLPQDVPVANLDARKQAITVTNLLNMTAGFAWDESSVPYGNLKNMETQMSQSPNWIKFVLDRPMADAPGSRFVYNSGAAHLLSALVERATGLTLAEFARTNLFQPLGIAGFTWPADPQGITEGHVDLRLTPRDMAKIGLLYLKNGVWDGRQVLPHGWAAASTAKHSGGDPGFGYQWRRTSFDAFEAVGWGSQLIGVLPAQDLVVVITGGVAPGEPGNEEGLFHRISQEAVKSASPLPANPEGQAHLVMQERAASQPSPKPVPPLNATALRIAGLTFTLAANADDLQAFRLTFGPDPSATSGANTAVLDLQVGGEARHLTFGLDNVYRMTDIGGSRYGLRGYWLTAKTLIIEQQVLGAADSTLYKLTFNGDQVDGQAAAHIQDHTTPLHGAAPSVE